MSEKIEIDLSKLSIQPTYNITLYMVKNLISNDLQIFLPNINDFQEDSFFNKKKLKLVNNTLDLTDNTYIQDQVILKAILTFFGSINLKNDFTQFTSDINSDLDNSKYLENCSNFESHLLNNIETIFSEFTMRDLRLFTKAINELGITIPKSINTEMRNYIMARNKILIVIAPSENFWVKSEKNDLNGKSYDKKLNNFNNIYYFWYFVRAFYEKVANHPRCQIGYISSMISKNIKPCIEFISLDVEKRFTKFLLFDQQMHDNLQTSLKAKPVFVRNLEKILNACKANKEYVFNETNLVIIESEVDKLGKTKENSVLFKCFGEDYFYMTGEKQKVVRARVDGLIEYLITLLEECETDIREYLAKYLIN
jgi:hypothetical protein